MKYLIFSILIALSISSCKKEDKAAEQAKKDEAIIQQYIKDNNLNALATGSGLHYVVHDYGIGKKPNPGSQVTVKYKGYFTDGKVFDQSSSITFYLQQVIAGWQEGILLFNAGGSGILLIPSHLAYGESGSGSVPPNTVLIFDIELKKVN